MTQSGHRSPHTAIDHVNSSARSRNASPIFRPSVAPSPFNTSNQNLIIALASELRLPAIYPFRYYAENGGLASHGFNTVEQHRGAASYVDRILKGEKPGDLPVQAPTKYDLVINLKTAKALGLSISLQLEQRADAVIE